MMDSSNAAKQLATNARGAEVNTSNLTVATKTSTVAMVGARIATVTFQAALSFGLAIAIQAALSADIPESGKVTLTVNIETQNQDYIYPTVKFLVASEDYNGLTRFTFNIHNEKTDYEPDLCVKFGLGHSNKEFTVDCEYGTCKVDNTLIIPDLNTNYDFFYLELGDKTVSVNVVTNNVYAPPSYLTIVLLGFFVPELSNCIKHFQNTKN